jgi:hypothetical protein
MDAFYFVNDYGTRINVPETGVVGREEVKLAYPGAPNQELKKISGSSFQLTLEDSNKLLLTRMSRNPIFVNTEYFGQGSVILKVGDRVKFGISKEETGYPLELKREEREERASEATGTEKDASEDGMEVDKAPENHERSPSQGPTRASVTPPEPENDVPKRNSASQDQSRPSQASDCEIEPPPGQSARQTELDRRVESLAAAERAIKPPSSIEGSVADDYAEAVEEETKTEDEEEERQAVEAEEYVSSESDVLGFSTDDDNMEKELWRNNEKMKKERRDKRRIAELKAMPLKAPKAERKPKKRPAPERSSSPVGSDEEEEGEPKPKKLRGPKTAYGRFAARERPKMKRKFPEETSEDITRLLRAKWKEIQDGKVAEDNDEEDEEASDEE